jgi:hypothetical protein
MVGGVTRWPTVEIGAAGSVLDLTQIPYEADHEVVGTENIDTTVVGLGHGVVGSVLVYDAPSRPLTTVVVTWDWVLAGHAGEARRISVEVNDDPLPTSPIPQLRLHLGSALLDRLKAALRTNLDRADRYAVHPDIVPIAVAAARALVADDGRGRGV